MKIISFLIIAVFIQLTGCSGSDNTAAKDQSETTTKSKTDAGTKHGALLGYKRTLDSAKSMMSKAEESEKKKGQMLQDLQ